LRVFRASRRPRSEFDPLDSSRSVAGGGWRFNDKKTEILYTAEREALALLEVAVRPMWHRLREINVACIEIPDDGLVDLEALAITLPSNWNNRPAADDARAIGREFLRAIDRLNARPGTAQICGVRVPSVLSRTDYNWLLDPRQKERYSVIDWSRIPFATLRKSST
jgi:RES domain-containing protein